MSLAGLFTLSRRLYFLTLEEFEAIYLHVRAFCDESDTLICIIFGLFISHANRKNINRICQKKSVHLISETLIKPSKEATCDARGKQVEGLY